MSAETWEEKFNEKYKRKYWQNQKSGEKTWKDPTSFGGKVDESEVVAKATLPEEVVIKEVLHTNVEWEEKYSDKHKRKFWRNKTSGETSWKEPAKISSKTVIGTAATTESIIEKTQNVTANDEWEEKYSDKHKRKFWKNKTSGETSWKEPAKISPKTATETTSEIAVKISDSVVADKIVLQSDGEWEEKYNDKHKRKYWRNKESGETSWKKPPAKANLLKPLSGSSGLGVKGVSDTVSNEPIMSVDSKLTVKSSIEDSTVISNTPSSIVNSEISSDSVTEERCNYFGKS